MPEASSFTIGSSPLNALLGAGSAGVAAQAEDGNAGGFQAMLAAQTDTNPAPLMDPGAGGTPAFAPVGDPTTGQMPPLAIDPAGRPAPMLAPMPATMPATMAALRGNGAAGIGGTADNGAAKGDASGIQPPASTSNGNLPVGGKNLPLSPALIDPAPIDKAPEAASETASDATPTAASDVVKPMLAKAMVAAPRSRTSVAQPPAQLGAQDDADQQDETPATGSDADQAAALPQADAPNPPAPGAAMLSATPSASANGNSMSSAEASAKRQNLSSATAVAMAGRQGRNALQTTLPAAPFAAAPATSTDSAGAALATGAIMPAASLQTLGGAMAGATEYAVPTAPAPTPGAPTGAKPVMKPGQSVDADTDPAAPISDGAAPQAGLALHQGGQAAASDHPAAGTDRFTDTIGTTLNSSQPSADTSRTAAPAITETGVSRDMSALVDRLVETRAAMRAGAPAQWVQTSIQHAEFGRVALQIRQDGDNLSVAMASSDPGFAPAAQAALNNAQSLLQPAAASQSSADAGQNSEQNQGQNNPSGSPINGQFSGNFSGNSSGQAGGQGQQGATRQQAPFANTPTPAPQGQAAADAAAGAPAGRTGSYRSGILA
ncbi:hypothetical protein [Novosphingobium sp. KACC 22771]|uniref:hypothetical protein n=1 Tax=Novosphingobium sp. KACC 22771 TaxID=3025670 RepID=UPI0023658221|nr:hypothetical protein [Novosphingobium sp. KACC 22771]WDF73258.1 hypothetical protein PQ467_04225 [Novosphingobium sp. KACC 22771]